jgi:transcriptional regulator with XRE-family HTH domain
VDKSKYLHNLGDRLAQERARLGLTQAQVAQWAEIARRTQVNYESGERAPDASYLDALSERGFDALYVLTGRRDLGLDVRQIAEPGATYKLAGLKPAHVRAAAVAVLTELSLRQATTANVRAPDTPQIAEAIVVLAEMSESVDDVAKHAAHVLRLLK